VLNRIRGPFNLSSAAIAAGAAAIEDKAHVDAAIRHNEVWLEWLTSELSRLGLKVTPSVANFVLVHFPAGSGHDAAAADAFLKSKAIILRRVTSYGLPGALRMTIGTETENKAVVAALSEFMAQ
jgi:histidinol-phosphate aminotransferase